MKIGITGSSGFIGKNLVSNLSKDFKLKFLKRNSLGLYSSLTNSMLADLDIIIFLAGVNRGENNSIVFGNTIPLFSLLMKLREGNLSPDIIFSSTLQIYGISKRQIKYSEDILPRPNSIYGLSKLLSEDLLRNYCQFNDSKIIILRIANVYGFGCRPYYNSVIATFESRLFEKNPLILSSVGTHERDFIYINDVVKAFERSIEYLDQMDTKCEIFNICTGKPTDIKKLANLMQEIYGIKTEIKISSKDSVSDFLIGDPTKARREMNFNTEIELKSGLRIMKECREKG